MKTAATNKFTVSSRCVCFIYAFNEFVLANLGFRLKKPPGEKQVTRSS